MLCDKCKQEIKLNPSPRQLQILRLLAIGVIPKNIATRLGISYRTVEQHKYQIMRKLNLHSTGQLIAWTIASGNISAEKVLQGLE